MKSALWVVVGVAIGFVVAHQLNRTPQGQRFFAGVEAKAKEFADAVVDGYRAREAELRAAADEGKAAAEAAALR